MLHKIVIIGPESTGKSTLCQQLATHYKTTWCPEYAREYLLKNGMSYTFDDLLVIAKGQLELESKHEQMLSEKILAPAKNSARNETEQLLPNDFLFIDTDQYVMKVWCEFVFNQCHTWILNRIAERPYDLYLLCNIDLPWIKDDLREYPDEGPRIRLYHMYKDLLVNQAVPWVDISGNYSERFSKAKAAIQQHFT
jgi:NadR type nicotinamide-nucleotide adenylyltransferase